MIKKRKETLAFKIAKWTARSNSDVGLALLRQIRSLRARGMHFLEVPSSYYAMLRERLAKSRVKIQEDLSVLEVRLTAQRESSGLHVDLELKRVDISCMLGFFTRGCAHRYFLTNKFGDL